MLCGNKAKSDPVKTVIENTICSLVSFTLITRNSDFIDYIIHIILCDTIM